jgi:hypothetical protein
LVCHSAADRKRGEELAKIPKAKGTRGQFLGGSNKAPPRKKPKDDAPTLAEMHVGKKEAARSEKLAAMTLWVKRRTSRPWSRGNCGHEGTRPRGHSSLMGAVDAQIAVKRDAADNIIATVELMKDGSQGDEFVSKLEVVEVGIDDDGDKITSCVIVPVEGLAPARGERRPNLTKGAKIALAALHEAIGECGEIPPASSHVPTNMKCVTIATWRDYSFRRGICSSDEPRAKRMAFQRASEGLIAAKSAAIWEPHVWPI